MAAFTFSMRESRLTANLTAKFVNAARIRPRQLGGRVGAERY
jgi:hypothetical protein